MEILSVLSVPSPPRDSPRSFFKRVQRGRPINPAEVNVSA